MKFLHLLKWDFNIANIDVVVFEQPLKKFYRQPSKKRITFQADMKDKTQFPKAAVAAMWVFDFVGEYEFTILQVLW